MAPRRKLLLVLLGPKGAGKSYLGKALTDQDVANFLSIEPLFLAVQRGRNNTDPGSLFTFTGKFLFLTCKSQSSSQRAITQWKGKL